jgi:predicted GNAT family acetyltransferase
MMHAERLDDVEAFAATTTEFLVADEARHNLILGLTGTIRSSPDLYPERHFWLVREDGRPVAAALQTPPHNLVLARPASDAALDALVEAVGGDLPGVTGSTPEVEAFTDRWTRRYGRRGELARGQGLFSLAAVEDVPVPSGSMRPATRDDFELLVDWWTAFLREAVPEEERDRAETERVVTHRLDADDNGIYIWDDPGPVSFAAFGNPTPNGARIGPVYTPPELRGRGYATALVAELSRELLAGGLRFCFLYTDLANPTANAIYERIGYVRVCESRQVRFD